MPTEPLLELFQVSCSHLGGAWPRKRDSAFPALSDVSLAIRRGVRFGVTGRSGAGKTTLARSIVGMHKPDRGEIRFAGRSIYSLSKLEMRSLRRRVQLVWQDSATAFNPRMSALEALLEPLSIQGIGNPRERRARADVWMERVGLPPGCIARRAADLSGGERQRLALARSLVLEPELLVLDESLSHLDLSTQAQILDLLMELNESRGLTLLLISHDLAVLGSAAEEIAVLDAGHVVEQGPAAAVLGEPVHQRTRELAASILPLPC